MTSAHGKRWRPCRDLAQLIVGFNTRLLGQQTWIRHIHAAARPSISRRPDQPSSFLTRDRRKPESGPEHHRHWETTGTHQTALLTSSLHACAIASASFSPSPSRLLFHSPLRPSPEARLVARSVRHPRWRRAGGDMSVCTAARLASCSLDWPTGPGERRPVFRTRMTALPRVEHRHGAAWSVGSTMRIMRSSKPTRRVSSPARVPRGRAQDDWRDG